MNIEIQYILAKSEGWEQLIILAVIFGFAILKKVFSAIKDYSERQSDSPDSTAYEEEPREHKPNYHATHLYDKNAFKTIEQIRNEKAAAIRARYGIPEPHKAASAPMELEPENVETLPEVSIRQSMFSPPPVPKPQPVYVPPTPKRPVVAPPPVSQAEYVQHSAYAQPAAKSSVSQTQKRKHPEHTIAEQSGVLIHLTSPEDLRAAILYQEILGKPLALRED